MADNLAVTNGTAATDDVSGAHYQRIKISDGTADSAIHLKVVAEDAAHASGDTGLVLMAVRQDTAAALATTDGDYAPLEVDALGRLHVRIGAIDVPSTFYHGQTNVTTAGTEVAVASSQVLLNGIKVKAKHANTGWIYVGKNPVTSTTGFVLGAGEEVFIVTDNVADVFIDSSVNGEGVSWLAS